MSRPSELMSMTPAGVPVSVSAGAPTVPDTPAAGRNVLAAADRAGTSAAAETRANRNRRAGVREGVMSGSSQETSAPILSRHPRPVDPCVTAGTHGLCLTPQGVPSMIAGSSPGGLLHADPDAR